MPKTLDPFRFLRLTVAGWMNQQQQHAIEYLREENRFLRAQLGGRRLRFTDDQRRSLAVKARLVGRKLGWHRKLITNKYDGSLRRSPGRPPTRKEIEKRVVRMATENRDWGYVRIQGALSNLGHELAHSTTADILKRNGLEPAPERIRKTTWKEFLTQHWEQIVASPADLAEQTDRPRNLRINSKGLVCPAGAVERHAKKATFPIELIEPRG